MPAVGYLFTVLGLCMAIVVSRIICVNADPLGRWLKVMDYPNAKRKRHARPTPQVGGKRNP